MILLAVHQKSRHGFFLLSMSGAEMHQRTPCLNGAIKAFQGGFCSSRREKANMHRESLERNDSLALLAQQQVTCTQTHTHGTET